MCPDCGSEDGKDSWETDRFDYGIGEEAVQLTATVLVWTCDSCGFRVTGEQAEDARDKALRDYLASHFRRPPAYLANPRSSSAYLAYVAISTKEELERESLIPEPPQVLVRLALISRGDEVPKMDETSAHPKDELIDAFSTERMSHRERVLCATHLSGCSRCLQYYHARVVKHGK